MKYLALLNDSFREALDSKMLYFTMGTSIVLLLILSTLRFQPMTAKDQAQLVVDFCNTNYDLAGQMSKEKAEAIIVEFEQKNHPEEPWKADYKIKIRLKLPAGQANSEEGRRNTFLLQGLLESQFWWMKERRMQRPEFEQRRHQKTVISLAPEMQAIGFLGSPAVHTPVQSLATMEFSKMARSLAVKAAQPKKKRAQTLHFILTNKGTKLEKSQDWTHDPQLFFGFAPLSKIPFVGIAFVNSLNLIVYRIEDTLVSNIGGAIIILIGVIVSAGSVPSMMQKGAVDLLIVKPISRPTLLIFKYLGGLVFVFLNFLVIIGGTWLVLGLRSGIWSWGFLLTVFMLTFCFSILYAVSVLFGVLTRNTLVALLITCAFWGLLIVLNITHAAIHAPPSRGRAVITEEGLKREKPKEVVTKPEQRSTWVRIIDQIHEALPPTSDLGVLTSRLITRDLLSESQRRAIEGRNPKKINMWATFGVSGAYIVVLLGLACWRFSAQDY